jgi:predicted RNA-binding protein (TIGR00451 family)
MLKERIHELYPLLVPHIDEIFMHQVKREKGKRPQLECVKIDLGPTGPDEKQQPKHNFYVLHDPMTKESFPLFYEVPEPKHERTLKRTAVNNKDVWAKSLVIPHLMLVHRFPDCFNTFRCDRGAIRFVLSGAPMMAPGLTSKGGRLPNNDNKGEDAKYGTKELAKADVVVIEAEGKEHACMVGVLSRGTKDIKETGKDAVLDNTYHYLGDGLWKLEYN